MITWLTYLNWPKTATFKGLSYENLMACKRIMDGPNYFVTVLIDIMAILLVFCIVYVIKNWKRL